MMALPDREIFRFRYYKVELKRCNWRSFVDSDNPVAAALLAKMGYNRKERRELRTAYLRMMLRLKQRDKLDDARLALIASVADLYYRPEPEEDRDILRELAEQLPEGAETLMELMPAWQRWGLEEGLEKGKAEGQAEERQRIVRKLVANGYTLAEVASTLDLPQEEVRLLADGVEEK